LKYFFVYFVVDTKQTQSKMTDQPTEPYIVYKFLEDYQLTTIEEEDIQYCLWEIETILKIDEYRTEITYKWFGSDEGGILPDTDDEEDDEWFIDFDCGEESVYFDTKEEMKKMFDLYVKDLREFGCITIEAPIKRPSSLECYGDDEAEDWMWGV